jgi:tRNA-2-methylthio-N6-dimethylallyladenosine synthase
MVKRDGDYKIMLRNVHPKFMIEMYPEFMDIFRCKKISYMSSAVESGSEEILKAMNRGYTAKAFKEAIVNLKNAFPTIQFNTQVMIGFPGETDANFRETMELIDDIDVDFVEVYIFQARPETKASNLDNMVPRGVAVRRFMKLYSKSWFKRYRVLVW